MKRNVMFVGLTIIALIGLSRATASSLYNVAFWHAEARNYANAGGHGSTLSVTEIAYNKGLDHICQLLYSTNGWKTSATAPADFQYFNNGGEVWTATVKVINKMDANYVFSFSCIDLGQTTTVNGHTTYGVTYRDKPRTTKATW